MDFCNDYHFLEALRIVKFILTVLKIVIPILLIGFGSYDYLQTILNSEENTLSNQTKKLTTRIVSAFMIFLIPTIVNIVFNLTDNFSDLSFMITTCVGNANQSYIKELKEAEKIKLEAMEEKSKTYSSRYDPSKYVLKHASNGAESSMYSFIMSYEGHTDYCDQNQTKYKAQDIGDGAVTIGYGITDAIYNVSVGDCVDTDIIDQFYMDHIDETKGEIEQMVKAANITDWNDAKTTAAISLSYNCGSSYGQKLVQSYAASGNEGALSVFKSCTHASNGNDSFTEGLKTRRDGEYELFSTGNYETGFYERQRKYIP